MTSVDPGRESEADRASSGDEAARPLSPPPDALTARSVGRAAAWAGAGQAVTQATWFGSLLLLAGLVPPSAFGTVSAVMVVVNVATLLLGSAVRGALITTERLTVEQIRYAIAVNLGMGVLVVGAVALLARPIVDLVLQGGDAAVVRWMGISIGAYAFSVVPLALLQRSMRFKREAGVLGSASVVASIVAVMAGFMGARSLVAGHPAGTLVHARRPARVDRGARSPALSEAPGRSWPPGAACAERERGAGSSSSPCSPSSP